MNEAMWQENNRRIYILLSDQSHFNNLNLFQQVFDWKLESR